jgi:CrcB protein
VTQIGWPGPTTIAAVAVGGAVGAVARYGLATALPTTPGAFPWTTLLINLTGCALIGALAGSRFGRHTLLRPLLGTGVLGGYTTFSTYAVETRTLVAHDRPLVAAIYALGTLVGALAAVELTHHLVRGERP